MIDFGDFQITKREILVSLAILFIGLALGFCISTGIADSVDAANEKYFKSLKINDNSTDRKLSITTYGSKNEYTNLWFPIMFIFLDIMALIMEDNKDDEK